MKTYEVRPNTSQGPQQGAVGGQPREIRENYVFFCKKRVIMGGTIRSKKFMRFAQLKTPKMRWKGERGGGGGDQITGFFVVLLIRKYSNTIK